MQLSGEYQGARQRVWFGAGSRRFLARAVRSTGGSRPMIVTGPTVAASGLVEELTAELDGLRPVVWDGSREHAPRSAVLAGADAARACGADVLISLGGSSPVEVARATAMALSDPDFATTPRTLDAPGDTAMLPVVAVTTTLSQAEFTDFVGVTEDDSGEKLLYADRGLLPAAVVLDAELTTRTPHGLWTATGIKALDSAIGGHVRQVPQLFRDPVTIRAVEELDRLLTALADGHDDLAARQELQIAAWMAMFPRFQLPTTQPNPPGHPWLGAAARHQLGGAARVRHGELSGVLLPAALAFHATSDAGRLGELAAPLGLSTGDLAGHVRQLVASLGLPTTLTQLGVEPGILPGVIEAVLREQPALAERRDDVAAALAEVT